MSKISVSNLQPLAGYVLVEPAPKTSAETKTAAGLLLPGSTDKKPQYGTVLALGGSTWEKDREVKAPVKVGDVVIYKQWGGDDFTANELTLDEKEYKFLKFDDIIAIIK